MQDRFSKPYHMHEDDDSPGSQFYVASSTDCTGLIPSAPVTENEVDSYNELYDVPLAKDPKDAHNHMQDIRKTKSSLFQTKSETNQK